MMNAQERKIWLDKKLARKQLWGKIQECVALLIYWASDSDCIDGLANEPLILIQELRGAE